MPGHSKPTADSNSFSIHYQDKETNEPKKIQSNHKHNAIIKNNTKRQERRNPPHANEHTTTKTDRPAIPNDPHGLYHRKSKITKSRRQ